MKKTIKILAYINFFISIFISIILKYFFSYLEPNKAMTYSICQKVFSILYYTNMQRRGTLANGHKK